MATTLRNSTRRTSCGGSTIRYLPFIPGSRWVYESDDGSERIEVVVLDETREILGITATLVRDTVTEDGELVEDTVDWYAQDRDGPVWYLGEYSKEVEREVVNTAGSWEVGWTWLSRES